MKTLAYLPSALCLGLLLVLAVGANADFTYVRSIPAPEIPCFVHQITGLDNTGSLLVVTAKYQSWDGLSGASYVALVSPSDGDVIKQDAFPGAPELCSRGFWQLSSCAYEASPGMALDGLPGRYWVGDLCGEIAAFTWDSGIQMGESFVLAGATRPTSLVASGDTLFALDDVNHWVIARYMKNGQWHTDTIQLSGGPAAPAAITIWRDHFLVSDSPQTQRGAAKLDWAYNLWEFTKDGQLVATHVLRNPRPCPPKNITVLDDQLYMASGPDSILVFEPTGFAVEVPAGDSVVVEAVPNGLEIVFDGVSVPGWLFCDVSQGDSCPPPDGVDFFSIFYEVTTTAHFDYAAQIIVSTDQPLPEGVDPARVRVFARPSGNCQQYEDITTEPAELGQASRKLTMRMRTKSEDDEFSLFTLAEDLRSPEEVVEHKFGRLEGAIDAGGGSIPGDVLTRIRRLLEAAHEDYYHGSSGLAANRMDSLAAAVRATPAIPHTFDPEVPGQNLAGRLISDAHTLAFSLRFSLGEAVQTEALITPDHFNESTDGWVRAYIEVPHQFSDSLAVDRQHIYLAHKAQAVPDSVEVGDFLHNERTQVKAVFSADSVRKAVKKVGATGTRLTCFLDGYEVYADVNVFGLNAVPMMIGEDQLLAGSTQRLDWEDSPCGTGTSVSLWYSPDAGASWQLVASDIADSYYDWSVPRVETDSAQLKVACTVGGAPATVLSSEFAIKSSAGVDHGGESVEPRLTVRPNPSASSFVLELALGGNRPVEVSVYSVTGELVKTLTAGNSAGGGLTVTWDGDNAQGSTVSAGTYFVIARSGNQALVRKLVLQR